MDLLPSVDALQEHLVAHDKAVRQIMLLDEYIERLSEQTIHSTMDGNMSPSFKRMIRIAVAEGIKRMYKEYRLQKWIKVQEMANIVRQVLSFASDDLPAVSDQSITTPQPGWPAPLDWQPAPTFQPLLSPIITPHRMPGTISTYHHPVVSPAHQASLNQSPGSGLYNANRQLFPVEQMPAIESAECTEDGLDISEAEESVLEQDNEIQDTAYTNRVHQGQFHLDTVQEMSHQNPGRFLQTDNRTLMPTQSSQYMEGSDDEEDEDDMMDWDEDVSLDENVAGVLFAAEHLLPGQQLERMDVEMGDMGIGHILFDRVSATWYTSHCEFYRVD